MPRVVNEIGDAKVFPIIHNNEADKRSLLKPAKGQSSNQKLYNSDLQSWEVIEEHEDNILIELKDWCRLRSNRLSPLPPLGFVVPRPAVRTSPLVKRPIPVWTISHQSADIARRAYDPSPGPLR
ncbi:unnamed protein product, partial [Iphiclides podalirius]